MRRYINFLFILIILILPLSTNAQNPISGGGPIIQPPGGVSTSADIIATFDGGACVGYLKSDGTCDTPAGAGDMAKATYDSDNDGFIDLNNGGFDQDASALVATIPEINLLSGKTSVQQQPAEGAFANGDKTKLDGVEALADVTDAGNVGPLITAQMGTAYDSAAEMAALFAGKQDADADLTTYAGITPSANVQTLLANANYADFLTDLFSGGYTAGAVALNFSSATVTLPTLSDISMTQGSSLILTDNNTIVFDATPDGMDDGEYNGEVIEGINHGETVGAIKCVFLAADGKVDIADADAAGEFPAFGLTVNGGDDTDAAIILVKGVVRDEDWTGLTVGGNIFLGDDGTGQITQTAPSTSGDCVQKIGVAISDSEIFFNFTGEYLEVE